MTSVPTQTDRPGLTRILTLVVVAGLLAGLVAALFSAVLTEPIIERAITIEEAAAEAEEFAGAGDRGHAHDQGEVVSRAGQRFGLWLGWGTIGIAWGTLIGAAYFLAWRRLPGARDAGWRLALAAGGWFTLGALPFLKYPANPPAVGNPDTVNERMRNFVGLELVAALLVVAGIALTIILIRRGLVRRAAVVAGVALVLTGGMVAFALFPAADVYDLDDELTLLVDEFRRHSFVGQMVFWSVFASAFTYLPRWSPFRLDETNRHAEQRSALAQAPA